MKCEIRKMRDLYTFDRGLENSHGENKKNQKYGLSSVINNTDSPYQIYA